MSAIVWSENERAICGATRGQYGRIRCEGNPGHNGAHMGRARDGRWFSWAPALSGGPDVR